MMHGAAAAGWQGTEWGMTPQQVANVLGELAPLDKGSPADSLGPSLTVGNKGNYVAGELRFSSSFYYDRERLALVRLELKQGLCARLWNSLRTRYGEPAEDRRGAAKWRDTASNTEIFVRNWGAGESDCFVSYSPLQAPPSAESDKL